MTRFFFMSSNKPLTSRIRKYMSSFDYLSTEEEIDDGVIFLYQEKIACGVLGDTFIVPVLEPLYSALLEKDPLVETIHTEEEILKGCVSVQPKRIEDDIDLLMFIMLGVTHATHKVLEVEK